MSPPEQCPCRLFLMPANVLVVQSGVSENKWHFVSSHHRHEEAEARRGEERGGDLGEGLPGGADNL